LVISAVGGGLGLALSYPVVGLFALMVPKSWFPVFYIEPTTVILAVVAALTVGLAASVFPVQRSLRTSIVDGLRFVG
jgi:putative ABC transport system permease protein